MKTVYAGGEGEIVEKKSRFIATVRPVSSEEEAVAFINEMKKKYCKGNVIIKQIFRQCWLHWWMPRSFMKQR